MMRGATAINPDEKIKFYHSTTDTTVHKHDFIEIVYFKSGQGIHVVDGHSYNIASGSVCILNTDTEHYYHIKEKINDKEIEVNNIIFYPSLIDEKYSSTNFIDEIYSDIMGKPIGEHKTHISVPLDPNKDMQHLFLLIQNEFLLKEEAYLSNIRLCLTALITKILRFAKNNKQKSSHILLKNIKTLEQILDMLDSNYNKPLTVEDISQKYYFSKTYMNTIFKEYTGMSLKKYIQQLRCEKAKELLKNTDDTVSQICDAVGYMDIKQFFIIFKRVVGITPKEYRIKSRQNKSE